MFEVLRTTKWLRFKVVGQKTKTLVIRVDNADGQILGKIEWYAQWRQYCFIFNADFPVTTILNKGCLDDISEMIECLMLHHKEVQNNSDRLVEVINDNVDVS